MNSWQCTHDWSTLTRAEIGAAQPAGAVLVFNKPTGWVPEQGGGSLVYGGLL